MLQNNLTKADNHQVHQQEELVQKEVKRVLAKMELLGAVAGDSSQGSSAGVCQSKKGGITSRCKFGPS
eukprot:619128-Karenia_brevis.AAC.1